MSFQDVVHLPSRAYFYTTFLGKCSRGEGLGNCGWGEIVYCRVCTL